MSISKATPEDVLALTKLINSAYRGEDSRQGWTTEEAILGGLRIDEKTLSDYFGQNHIYILKYTSADGKILGTVNLELKMSDLYLGMFAVSPAAQGKGIGNALLKEAERIALANGRELIAITVISSRIELIEWYKRKGYVATGALTAFEDIEGRFGEPKQENITLMGMQKKLSV